MSNVAADAAELASLRNQIEAARSIPVPSRGYRVTDLLLTFAGRAAMNFFFIFAGYSISEAMYSVS